MSNQLTKHLIHRHRALVCLLAVPLAFMLLGGQCAAQHEVPFPLRGAGGVVGILPDGTLQIAWSGTAAHLGKYTATGTLSFETNGIDFEVSGTYTAADGAQISFVAAGQLESPLGSAPAIPGTGTATFFDGTGRLEGVTGEVRWAGVLNSDFTFTVQHEGGGLIFPKRHHSSPFAGSFLIERPFYAVCATISDSGKIQGSFSGGVFFDFGAPAYVQAKISGRIANDGSFKLKDTLVRYNATTGKRIDAFSATYTGVGALDEFGNLYGELKDEYGNVFEFFWPRCGPGVP
jgi:hypothetical protein